MKRNLLYLLGAMATLTWCFAVTAHHTDDDDGGGGGPDVACQPSMPCGVLVDAPTTECILALGCCQPGQCGPTAWSTNIQTGGDIGPDLTDVASVRTLSFIIESILFPSAEIASGFEAVSLRTTDGRNINGVLRQEDNTSIALVTRNGEGIVVLKSDVSRRLEDPPSLMPDNFADLLSVQQFHDIIAFLRSRAVLP